MPWTDFVEKELIGKRFLLAVFVVLYFAYTGSGEGIVGTVIGYYFGTHQGGGVATAASG